MPLRLRRLVLNADDAGIDVPRNVGIVEAFAAGALRSATVLTTAPAFPDFVRRVEALTRGRRPAFGVGVHLNLSECCPPATRRGVPGAFVAKEPLWARAARGELDPDLVEVELGAQLERALDAGLAPTHVDGHNHVHVFPCVAAALDRLEERFPFVARRRVPDEFALAEDRGDPPGVDAKRGLFRTALAQRPRAARRVGPAAFAGFGLERACTFERLTTLLAACPHESLEVMLHPGRCDQASVPFSAEAEREAELAVLVDPRLVAWLAREGVTTAHYGDFSDVSD